MKNKPSAHMCRLSPSRGEVPRGSNQEGTTESLVEELRSLGHLSVPRGAPERTWNTHIKPLLAQREAA
jgi:hypothetical protein